MLVTNYSLETALRSAQKDDDAEAAVARIQEVR